MNALRVREAEAFSDLRGADEFAGIDRSRHRTLDLTTIVVDGMVIINDANSGVRQTRMAPAQR